MAWMSRRDLINENIRLTYRVAELEERLCPTEQHDWLTVGYRIVYVGCGESNTINRYKCRKCGKEKEDLF